MKKRFLAFLLALSISASLLVMPASAAGSNAAVQAAVALGGMTTEQAAEAACNARIAEFKEILGAAAYDVDVPVFH